jgi:hypothetical protein
MEDKEGSAAQLSRLHIVHIFSHSGARFVAAWGKIEDVQDQCITLAKVHWCFLRV